MTRCENRATHSQHELLGRDAEALGGGVALRLPAHHDEIGCPRLLGDEGDRQADRRAPLDAVAGACPATENCFGLGQLISDAVLFILDQPRRASGRNAGDGR